MNTSPSDYFPSPGSIFYRFVTFTLFLQRMHTSHNTLIPLDLNEYFAFWLLSFHILSICYIYALSSTYKLLRTIYLIPLLSATGCLEGPWTRTIRSWWNEKKWKWPLKKAKSNKLNSSTMFRKGKTSYGCGEATKAKRNATRIWRRKAMGCLKKGTDGWRGAFASGID